MGRVRSPHPYGLRKYLTMPDGATATFDLFEPCSEHCTGGQSNSCWLHRAATLDSVLWGTDEDRALAPIWPSEKPDFFFELVSVEVFIVQCCTGTVAVIFIAEENLSSAFLMR